MTDHREKAAEAATLAYYGETPALLERKAGGVTMARAKTDTALAAAEPHLQRMYWERFREAVLSNGGVDAASSSFEADEWVTGEFPESAMCDALEAALDKAQNLMEESKVKLTKPQQRLLRTLADDPFGVELGGKWVGTGAALVRRGLAKGSRSFISITAAGQDLMEESK